MKHSSRTASDVLATLRPIAISALLCLIGSALIGQRVGDLPDPSPVEARPNSTFVTALGADPKGQLDSAPAFQKALKLGKPIWVSAGNYRIKSAITLPPNSTNIILEGKPGTVTLFADPSNHGGLDGNVLLTAVNASNLQVRGLVFDGNGAKMPQPSSAHTRLVYLDGATNVVFSWDAWRNSGGSALVFSGVHTAVVKSGVRHSKFSDLGFAWKAPGRGTLAETAPVVVFANAVSQPNQDNFVSDNEIFHVGSDAVSVQQQTRFSAERNKLTLNMEGWQPNANDHRTFGVGGFYIFHNDADVVLRNNEVTGATGNCFDLAEISELQVTENTASRCGGAGVSIGQAIHHFSVTANTLTGNYRSAHTQYANHTHQGSVSFGCGHQPCSAKDTITNGTVKGNIFTSMGQSTRPIDVWQEKTVALVGVTSDPPITKEQTQP